MHPTYWCWTLRRQCHVLQSGRGAQAATPQQSLEGGITQLLNSTATNTFTLNEKQVSSLQV